MKKNNNLLKLILIIIVCIGSYIKYYKEENNHIITSNHSSTLKEIPIYNGEKYITLNNNEPTFTKEELLTSTFELYGDLDELGRATSAYAIISTSSMPDKERENIGMIKPSGWHTIKYDNISGKYLYNRCHLIGYQLTGENANINNLITCTRQTNNEVMLYFENMVAKYIKETNNHVIYRAVPIYESNNLLASGIHLEALSIEDEGKGIKFNVYIYNVQEGIFINYENGESKKSK